MQLLANRITTEQNNDNTTEIPDDLADGIPFIRPILYWNKMI